MFLMPLINLTQKVQNWFYFVLSRLPSPKQSSKKNKALKFFSMIGLIALTKNIKQYIRQKLFSVGLTKLTFKFCI